MTRIEAMAAVAQGVINVTEAETATGDNRRVLRTIEHGSRIFRGMVEVCEREKRDGERLREVLDMLDRKKPSPEAIRRAVAIVETMHRERTDVEFEPDALEATRANLPAGKKSGRAS